MNCLTVSFLICPSVWITLETKPTLLCLFTQKLESTGLLWTSSIENDSSFISPTSCCLSWGLQDLTRDLALQSDLSVILCMTVSFHKCLVHHARSTTKMQMFLESGKKIKENVCAWCAGTRLNSAKSDLSKLNKTRSQCFAKYCCGIMELHGSKL